MLRILALFSIIGVMVLLALAIFWYENHLANNWKEVASGVFKDIEYRSAKRTRFIVSVINFEDGSSYMVTGHPQMPEPGTPIRITKNGLSQLRIEKAA